MTPPLPTSADVAAHTPGPWELVQLNRFGPFAIRMQYSGEKTFYGVREIHREQDARVIAAAPEILAALVELRDWYVEYVGLPAARANAAIAKATGLTDNWPEGE